MVIRTELYMTKYITCIHTYKNGLDQLVKMMSFTKNDWGQRDIINKITVLTKRGADTIYTSIPMKYQNYHSTTIIKHANVLAKVNKLPYGSSLNVMPHDSYSIKIHVHTMIIAESSHEQKD